MNFYSREDTSSRQPVLTVTTDGMSSDPVLAAAGDIGCASSDANYNNDLGATGYCHQLYTSNTVLNDPLVTAVASLGDHQYDNNTPANYAAVYQPNWGRYFAKDYPATGNHEYQYPTGSPGTTDVTKMALGYYGYFLDKANGSRSLTSTGQSGDCKSACLGYYSYDLGTWHIIVLNAQCTGASGSESNYDLGTGACAAGSTQEQWLQSDLAAHTNVCTLAYWHQPRYSSGGHQNNSLYDDFWKDLYNAGAEVVLNGHDHDYERIALQKPVSSNSYGDGTLDTAFGLREFVAGTGGKNHASLGSHTVVNSEAYDNTTFGILKLTLHPGSYDWTFANESGGTPDGSFTDSGTQLCHGVTTTPIP